MEEEERYRVYERLSRQVIKLEEEGKIDAEKAGKLLLILDHVYRIKGEPFPKLENLLRMNEDMLDDLEREYYHRATKKPRGFII